MPGKGVDPGQDRLARAVGLAGFVNLEPGVLQQILSVCTAPALARKKSQ
jgi:hypothetical protein